MILPKVLRLRLCLWDLPALQLVRFGMLVLQRGSVIGLQIVPNIVVVLMSGETNVDLGRSERLRLTLEDIIVDIIVPISGTAGTSPSRFILCLREVLRMSKYVEDGMLLGSFGSRFLLLLLIE